MENNDDDDEDVIVDQGVSLNVDVNSHMSYFSIIIFSFRLDIRK
jgi:hypothetical protein